MVLLILLKTTAAFPQTTGRLPVVITDSRTRLPVPFSTVCIGNVNRCQTADSSGTVRVDSLTPGLFRLSASADGYDTLMIPSLQIQSGLNKTITIELTKSVTIQSLDKITVVARRLNQKKPEQTNSVTRVGNFELSNTAGTGNDVNRVLAVLPSTVSGIGEGFDNNLYVRGGGSRENVYLIDGIPFDNASHFSSVDNSGGAIGFLNGNLVQSLDFYAGGFPARMPSRLSSVIDMTLRSGSFTERKHQFDLNMSGVGITTEGPIAGGAGSYIASVRMVDLTFLKKLLTVGGLPRYGDVQLKMVFTPASNQTIKLVGIGAFDHFDEDPETWLFADSTARVKYDEYLYQGGGGISWDAGTERMRNVVGLTGSARHEDAHDDFLNFQHPVETDTFRFNLTQYNKDETVADSIIDPGDTLYLETGRYARKRIYGSDDRRWRLSLTEDFSLFVGEQDQINAGLFADNDHFYIKNEAGWEGETFSIYLPDGVNQELLPGSYSAYTSYYEDSSMSIRHGGAYLEYVFQHGPVKAIAGVRGDYYTVLTDYGVSPRIGLSVATPSYGTFSVSGGVYYQFPSDFSGLLEEILALSPYYSDATEVPLDKARLQRNWQGVLGYERQIGEAHLLTTEAYYKWYDREYPFTAPDMRRYGEYENGTFVWMLDKPDGKKRAYGLEISFQKKRYDTFYYSFNYSLFQVENEYTDGTWYLDENSIRNAAGISLGSNFLKNHGIALRLQVSEGKPCTPAVRDAASNRWVIDSTRAYYSDRLDPIISLNLRYSFKVFRKWGNITGYLEVWNILNNQPVVERYLDSRRGFVNYTTNGILPVAGFTVDF